ncbi:MAG: CehA/McbA family metallohydrolase [Verrucomicrobiae bacterium]|nr:CehA/McbA family metallohydrolase [Verrucomicrobiae bacterium]
MSHSNPFSQKGLWLKGNTHTHTTQSDGKLPPRETVLEYQKAGYDFLFLTDHWKRTEAPSPAGGPLVIAAEELDFFIGDQFFHIIGLGIQKEWARRKFRSLRELNRLAKREKAILIVAHPYWSGNPSSLYQNTSFFGIEVYNAVCDVLNGKGYSDVHWDDLLDAGQRILGFAADDYHRPNYIITPGWIMVKAAARTEAAILQAIRRGRFYSTQGPVIKNITLKKRLIEVTCSPASRIHFIANRCHGTVIHGRNLTRASWQIPPHCKYVRVECVDAAGKTAWSNPFFLSP